MRLLAPILVLLLTGCATRALPERDAPALPDGFVLPAPPAAPAGSPTSAPALTPALAPAALLAADPAFAPLRSAALTASPDVAVAVARLRQARAGLAQARAAGLPEIGARAGVDATRISLEQFAFDLPPGAIDRDLTLYNVGLSASWEIDLFGRLAAGRAAARSRLDAANADAAGVALAVETDVARRLVAVRLIDARLLAVADARALAEELAHIARVRAAAGLATALDVATTEADLRAVDAAIPPLTAARKAETAALLRLTAMPMASVEQLLAIPAPEPRAGALPEIPTDLLARRPDVQAAFARLRAADADAAAAMAQRFPRLTLTGSLGWLAAGLGGLFTGDALTLAAGGALAGPLLDFGRTAALVEQQQGVAAEAAASLRGTVLGAIAEVETSLAASQAARTEADGLAASARALAEARSLADVRYRGGLEDARSTAEAGRRLADARDRALAAELRAIDSLLLLQLATAQPLVVAAPQPR